MPMVSSICSMRGMPRVATDRTWVSPRWKRPQPCAVGMRPISADRGRMSAGPRPSMRMPSSTMRLRTIFFWRDRTAALISLSRPSNSAARSPLIPAMAASVARLRSALLEMALASVMRSVPTSATRANTSSA